MFVPSDLMATALCAISLLRVSSWSSGAFNCGAPSSSCSPVVMLGSKVVACTCVFFPVRFLLFDFSLICYIRGLSHYLISFGTVTLSKKRKKACFFSRSSLATMSLSLEFETLIRQLAKFRDPLPVPSGCPRSMRQSDHAPSSYP